jgi:hypothetical protein
MGILRFRSLHAAISPLDHTFQHLKKLGEGYLCGVGSVDPGFSLGPQSGDCERHGDAVIVL